MSEFAVTVETIGEIRPHTNADRLEIAKLASMDFQFVVMKDTYKVGDTVIYFPVDSLLTDKLTKILGLEGKLGRGNRIKTIKLRGEISQGVVVPYDELIEHYDYLDGAVSYPTSFDLSKILGVEKYEVPEELVKNGRIRSLPADQRVYDIESVQRFPEMAALLQSMDYVVTEKLEGSHFSIVKNAGGTWICSRRMLILSDDGQHTWHKVAMEYDLTPIMDQLWDAFKKDNEFESLALHGELIGPGIQGNIYNLAHHHLYFFDLILDGNRPVPFLQFCANMNDVDLPVVPVLRIPAGVPIEDFVAYSNGKSALRDSILREGIVIRPYTEELVDQQGRRVQLKVRSPEYLAKSEL